LGLAISLYKPTAQHGCAVARQLYSVIFVSEQAGLQHNSTLHVFCASAAITKKHTKEKQLTFCYSEQRNPSADDSTGIVPAARVSAD